ncbi:MAG: hypothetical protein M3O68_07795 [Thermoproteota archaeon]|nr:hypothetical protein [Thermoproteota archaeon]
MKNPKETIILKKVNKMPHTSCEMVQVVQTYVVPIGLAVVFSLVTAGVYDYLTPSKLQITKHTTDPNTRNTSKWPAEIQFCILLS